MFGYVKISPPDLRLREYACYRSIYCGLCRCMGKTLCPLARITLRYDFAFLALCRMALSGTAPTVQSGRCLRYPFRRHPFALSSEPLVFTSRVGALLTYYQLRDARRDRGSIGKKLLAGIAAPLASSMRKKALRAPGLGPLDQTLSALMDVLDRAEHNPKESPDGAADCFGQLLSVVFAEGLDGSAARIGAEIGYHTGRWIYLADALDDLEKDEKYGSYNPFLLSEQGESAAALRNNAVFLERARKSLTLTLSRTEAAAALLDCPQDEMREVIQNILYIGMPAVAEQVLSAPPARSHVDSANPSMRIPF